MSIVLAVAVSTTLRPGAVEAQEILHPERVVPLVSLERIGAAARRDAEIARALADARTRPARRVDLAHERATQEAELGHALSMARQTGVTVEPAARLEWERLTRRTLETVDGRRASRECVEVARADGVMSDAAFACRRSIEGDRALPWPLYVMGATAEFTDDRRGEASSAAYRRTRAQLARAPDDRRLLLALSAMQVLLVDPLAARATLSRLPADDYEARVNRALADYSAGRSGDARRLLEAAIVAAPDRPEAPFDWARLAVGRDHYGRLTRESATRALAGFRLHLCNAGDALAIPRAIHRASAELAHEIQTSFEDPPNSWGGWSVRPVVPRDRLPRGMLARWAEDVPPMMDCATARARALDVIHGFGTSRARLTVPPAATSQSPAPAPSSTVRAVWPPVGAVVGPRPTFRWTGGGAAEIALCADADCRREHARFAGAAGRLTVSRAIPAGRWYWRVADGPTRVLWVEAHARAVSRIEDLDGDGWPDVPLLQSGWYARFEPGDGAPTLRALPGHETSTADTRFAGDLDGDGLGDLVQSSGYGLWVIHGSRSGPRAPVHVAGTEMTNWAVGAGDVDSDGFEDLLVDQSQRPEILFFGPRDTIPRPMPAVVPLAWRMLPIGDANGDSWTDWAIFENDYQAQTGRWTFHLGGSGGIGATPQSAVRASYQPWSVHPLGDVDGDGLDDIAIWSHDRNERDPPGRFRVFGGTRDGVASRPRTEVATDDPYVDILPLGDLDGDGRGETLWQSEERIWVRAGSVSGFGAEVAIGPRRARTGLVAVRVPGSVGHPVVWIFAPPGRTVIRLDGGQTTTLELPAP